MRSHKVDDPVEQLSTRPHVAVGDVDSQTSSPPPQLLRVQQRWRLVCGLHIDNVSAPTETGSNNFEAFLKLLAAKFHRGDGLIELGGIRPIEASQAFLVEIRERVVCPV